MATPAPRSDRPFLPSDLPRDQTFIRAITAHAVAAARGPGVYAGQVSRELWPRDTASLAVIERSVTSFATTSTSGWASQLAATAVAGFVGSLQESAASKLIAAAPRFNVPGVAVVRLPRASATGTPLWTAEGAAIPIGQGTISSPQLGPPKKLALVESCTREIAETGDAENVISILLRDSMTRALDQSMFSATAGDATRPAGVLAGVSGLTGTSGGGANACLADLRALLAALATGGGSGTSVFVCSPGRQLAIENYAPSLVGRVFGSASIADTTLIAVDPRAFASMFSADVEITASSDSTLYYEDTTPADISAPGAPNTISAPVRSLFQVDSIAIRAVLRASWVMRVPAVSFISTPSW